MELFQEVCLMLFVFIVPLLIIAIPIRRFVIFVKRDTKLQQKKKEKEIELLQARIDSLKKEKGT